jgi:hypothetical protein
MRDIMFCNDGSAYRASATLCFADDGSAYYVRAILCFAMMDQLTAHYALPSLSSECDIFIDFSSDSDPLLFNFGPGNDADPTGFGSSNSKHEVYLLFFVHVGHFCPPGSEYSNPNYCNYWT